MQPQLPIPSMDDNEWVSLESPISDYFDDNGNSGNSNNLMRLNVECGDIDIMSSSSSVVQNVVCDYVSINNIDNNGNHNTNGNSNDNDNDILNEYMGHMKICNIANQSLQKEKSKNTKLQRQIEVVRQQNVRLQNQLYQISIATNNNKNKENRPTNAVALSANNNNNESVVNKLWFAFKKKKTVNTDSMKLDAMAIAINDIQAIQRKMDAVELELLNDNKQEIDEYRKSMRKCIANLSAQFQNLSSN